MTRPKKKNKKKPSKEEEEEEEELPEVKFEDYHVTRKEMNTVMVQLAKEYFKHKEVIDRTGEVPPLTPEEEAAHTKQGEAMADA